MLETAILLPKITVYIINKTIKMSTILLPKNLNVEELLEIYPPDFKCIPDNLKYILGTITRLMDSRDEEYAPLNAQILQGKVHDYKHHLNYLEQHEIIETNKYYKPGSKSKGYRLTDEYAHTEAIPVTLHKWSLVKEKSTTPCKYLDKWFEGLEINETQADLILESLSEQNDKYYSGKRSIERIKSGIYNKSLDDNVGRYHSVLTNLKTELRRDCKINCVRS